MELFVTKPLSNVNNVINAHSLYVIYEILRPCNQFLNRSPFYHIYVTVNHNITRSTKADMLTHVFY